MKRWLILLVPLLLLGLALPALGEVKIVVPAEPVTAGDLVQIPVSGVAAADFPSTKIVVWPREKVLMVPVRTLSDQLVIFFSAKVPGKYLLYLDGKVDSAEGIVTVGGEVPQPPSPNPPGPQPGGPFQLMFIFQSDKLDNLPAGQREILASLKFRKELEAKGHLLRGFFDLDSGKDAPKELLPFFAGVDGASLPCVRVSPYAGGKIETFPLPADPAALWKLLADPKGAAIDRDFLQENHWRLTPGTCGMFGCFKHGSQWILEATKGGAR